jgi:hypothetical protein
MDCNDWLLSVGETPEAFSKRADLIHDPTRELTTGQHSMEEVDAITEQIRKLKGLPPDEFRTFEEEFDED